MFKQPNLSYDGTDYCLWNGNYNNNTNYNPDYLEDYSSKDFLIDLSQEKKTPKIIRFLNVFLYGAMIIVDWIEKRLNK